MALTKNQYLLLDQHKRTWEVFKTTRVIRFTSNVSYNDIRQVWQDKNPNGKWNAGCSFCLPGYLKSVYRIFDAYEGTWKTKLK